MSKELTGAVIKSTEGDFTLQIQLHHKPFILKWEKKNDHQIEVPMTVGYVDDFGKKKVIIENLPKHLLISYKHLKLVKEVYSDIIPKTLTSDLPSDAILTEENSEEKVEKKSKKQGEQK